MGHRLGVFARRPAPVQASWIGWIDTTGLDTIDHLISDGVEAGAGRDALIRSIDALIKSESLGKK